MNSFELNFLINKICCAIAITMQIKKSYMHDLAEHLEQLIYPQQCQPLRKSEFVIKMSEYLNQIDLDVFGGLNDRIATFATNIRQNRLPDNFQSGKTFLGKYLIQEIIPYSIIFKESL